MAAKTKMTKVEMAEALAAALNALNSIVADADTATQNVIYGVFAMIPAGIRLEVDFANNGLISGSDFS